MPGDGQGQAEKAQTDSQGTEKQIRLERLFGQVPQVLRENQSWEGSRIRKEGEHLPAHPCNFGEKPVGLILVTDGRTEPLDLEGGPECLFFLEEAD